jgi:hypothetical protein
MALQPPKVVAVAAQWCAARICQLKEAAMSNQRQSSDKQQPQSGQNVQQGGQPSGQNPGQQNQSGTGSKTPQQGGGAPSADRDSQNQHGKSGQQGSKNR